MDGERRLNHLNDAVLEIGKLRSVAWLMVAAENPDRGEPPDLVSMGRIVRDLADRIGTLASEAIG